MKALRDLIPARYRKAVYALVTLAGIVVAAWQAAGGDWKIAVAALIASATNALAAGNTVPVAQVTYADGTPARVGDDGVPILEDRSPGSSDADA